MRTTEGLDSHGSGKRQGLGKPNLIFTAENLGVGLAQEGKKVLLVDMDPQASLTISFGHPRPDELPVTISDMMQKVIIDEEIQPREGILTHPESVDLMRRAFPCPVWTSLWSMP